MQPRRRAATRHCRLVGRRDRSLRAARFRSSADPDVSASAQLARAADEARHRSQPWASDRRDARSFSRAVAQIRRPDTAARRTCCPLEEVARDRPDSARCGRAAPFAGDPARAITPAGRRAARACAIPPTRRPWRRSSPSCATPPRTGTAGGCTRSIVVLWRAGLRVQEALALAEHDLDPRRGSILVRCGKGGRRREVGMDDWGWEHLRPWLTARVELPVGPLFCIIDGPTRGRPWSGAAVRTEFRRVAAHAGVRRRFAPHQLRHAHALELAREGVPLNIIQRQLGIRTSAPQASICRASIPRRSSRRCVRAARR